MPPGRPLEAPGRPVRACVRRHRPLSWSLPVACHIDRAHRWCVRAPATGRDGSAMVRGCPGVVRGCGGGGSRPRSGRCTRELTAVPRPSRRLVRRRTRCTPGRAAHARTRRCSSSRCSSCGRRRLPRPRRGRTTPSPTAASTSPARRGPCPRRGADCGNTLWARSTTRARCSSSRRSAQPPRARAAPRDRRVCTARGSSDVSLRCEGS